MRQVSVKQLHDDNRDALALTWRVAQDSAAVVRREDAASAALIGHLNLTHPNYIQVLGAYEASLAATYDSEHHARFAARLFAATPVAVIVADGIEPLPGLEAGATAAKIPLFTTPRSAVAVIEKLARYLGKSLADTVELHGVFMDVLGVGVLVTGESGVGKSELGLELISRGHGLVADDVVEFRRVAATTLEGRCPPLLRDFIEVRGLGLLNVRTIFGQTAVRPKMKLKLIARLERPAAAGMRDAGERLPLSELSEHILGVTVRKVVIPVAAGRNLAVLLEAAVRNYILQLRGIDSMEEFAARQREAIDREAPEE